MCMSKVLKNKFMILSLYVDDILLAGNDKEYLLTVKAWLSSNFEMKDMGEAAYILGVKITKDHLKRMLALHKSHISRKFLKDSICKIASPLILLS